MIDRLRPHYSVTLLCRLLEYPRRSFYYVPVPSDDTALRTAIEQIMIRWPFYGYRRVTAQLRREGWTINSKLVRRLRHELGLAYRIGRVRWHTTDSAHGLPRYPNLVRIRPGVRILRTCGLDSRSSIWPSSSTCTHAPCGAGT